MPATDPQLVPAGDLREGLKALFCAWGVPPDQAATTAEVLVEADLMGIDSHGITLIPLYDELLRSGKVVAAAEITVARAFGAIAVVDGGGGFGQAPAMLAMDLAVDRAKAYGVGAVAVRNSNHYGAAGSMR